MAQKRSAARPRARSGAIASSGESSDPSFGPAAAQVQEDRDPLRYVCDGLTQLGVVYDSDSRFEAVLTSGLSLGSFKSVRLASSAISAAERGECTP
jgi:hypothetical protein